MRGAAVTPSGEVINPPVFRQPSIAPSVGPPTPPITAPVSRGGPVPPTTPDYAMRDPSSGLRYPVDPGSVFPRIIDQNLFNRYWTNPNLQPEERQYIRNLFAPRVIEDVNKNQWQYSPNQRPVLIQQSLGTPTDVDMGNGVKLKGFINRGEDGIMRTLIPRPVVVGGDGGGGAGASASTGASGGIGGPLGALEPFREEQGLREARNKGLVTEAEEGAKSRQKPLDAAIQRGPTAQKEIELLNSMDILSRQVSQIQSGPLADLFVEAGKGLKEITNGALGWDTSGAEGVSKLGGQLAALAAREITNRPALAEFKTMVLSNPSIYNSVAGRAMLIDLIRQSAGQDVKLADLATNADSRHWPQIRNQFFNNPENSLTIHYKGKAYQANPEGIAQFARDTAPVQEGGPRQIRSQREYDELPEGHQYIGSDGKTRTKQGETQ
jgi:hypothetical protein